MTLQISTVLLLPAFVIGPALRAQPVFHDSQAPQVAFASAEIARALEPERATADRGASEAPPRADALSSSWIAWFNSGLYSSASV